MPSNSPFVRLVQLGCYSACPGEVAVTGSLVKGCRHGWLAACQVAVLYCCPDEMGLGTVVRVQSNKQQERCTASQCLLAKVAPAVL
jgi:hypothetical protein